MMNSNEPRSPGKCKRCGQVMPADYWVHIEGGSMQTEHGRWGFSGYFCSVHCLADWILDKEAGRFFLTQQASGQAEGKS